MISIDEERVARNLAYVRRVNGIPTHVRLKYPPRRTIENEGADLDLFLDHIRHTHEID